MRPIGIIAIVLASLGYFSARAYGNEADDIVGFWNTKDGQAQFEIYRCGDEYCGKISWLKEPNYPANEKRELAGRPKMDLENPDPNLRTRTQLGLQLIEGFSYVGEEKWEGGKIYNPEDGKKYRCKIWLDGNDRLKLRGYIGFSLLGRTETWIRAAAPRT
jgi:uncharacterized protein (DUF2147 family)